MMKTKHLLQSLIMATCLMFPAAASAQEELTPAFPGAEGFGRYTTGGRGGAVYHVTKLTDDGSTGTFRWACERSGSRTIVFDVAGTIHLTSELTLTSGNVTIAGQTAPGYGVCIADYPFQIAANNVILRYMRFRLGNKNVTLKGADGWDGLGGMDHENIIVDHCSVSWSIDECLSVYGVKNATVQWCIAAQSLQDAGHSKGSHGYGGNWGGSGVTYHHNLLAHHESRVPRLGPRYTTQLDERMDMRNNVFYNWAGNGCYGGEAMNVNIVNNYYQPGPATRQRSTAIQQRIASIGVRTNEYISNYPDYAPTLHKWGTFYVAGNVNAEHDEVTRDNWTYGIYNQISDDNDGTYTDKTKEEMRLDAPISFVHVTTHTAKQAYGRVLDYAGCSKKRDSYDEFIISETRNGAATYTGAGNHKGIIDTPEDNRPVDAGADWSPWPDLTSDETAPADTDGDGMPDEWETANGLDPGNPDDGAETGTDGYTNLEKYLNSLVSGITEGQLEGGEVMGEDRYESDAPATDYTLSPFTYESTDADGNWLFSNGFSITPASGDYSTGSALGMTGIKFSRNRDYTINIPAGITITSVTIEGYCNGDGQTAYLSELGDETFSATDYVYPARNGNTTASYDITLASPATGSLPFRIGGDNQCVWDITLFTDASTGITGITATDKLATGKIYNLQGMEMTEPLPHGIYISDGKKFVRN